MMKITRSFISPKPMGYLAIAFASTLAIAGPITTTLPNGAELSVSLDDPVSSTEFNVPAAAGPGATIDVPVAGTASIGEGNPNVLLVEVVDVSFSVTADCDGGDILDCEKQALSNLNSSPGIQSVLDLGVVVYAAEGAVADMTPGGGDDPITDPVANAGDVATVVNSIFHGTQAIFFGGVDQFTHKEVSDVSTNFTVGLDNALTVVNASAAQTKIVVFLSDGESNTGGAGFNDAVDAIANADGTIYSFAVGADSSCTGGTDGTLEYMAITTGGTCTEVENPADLPDILPDLIGTTLDNVQVKVNGGDTPTATDVVLPADGPVTTNFDATASSLGVGDHEICATATGSDMLVPQTTLDVTECADIHLLQLTASPADAVNELNSDNTHTVTAEILGGSGPVRDIGFVVQGQNAGTAVPSNAAIPAGPNTPVDFNYMVPQVCDSLGMDNIIVTATIGGVNESIQLNKEWIDTVPPELSCDPTVNPHGNNKPTAPGQGGQGQNQDGYYQLNTSDPTLNCEVTLSVMDEDGYVFPGPFNPGDNIKYTQDDDIPQEQKKIGSGQGQAGAVVWHLIGHGDLQVTATDTSGNQSFASCLVPEPPK